MLRRQNLHSVLAAVVILAATILSQHSFAQEETAQKCAPGYGFDEGKNSCIACNQPCDTGLHGICRRGIFECGAEKSVCRSAINPGERMEICNGEDDNCDGRVDEGFDKDGDGFTTCGGDCNDRDATVYPDAIERCNGKDDNCNGLIDEGFNVGGFCTAGLGECAVQGKLKCSSSGLESFCDAEPKPPSREICNGKDDDCNGLIDDALGTVVCGVGACRTEVSACIDGREVECIPGMPGEELCGDKIDNDCDGRIDEGFEALGSTCSAGIGACKRDGKMVCSEDKLSLICDAVAGEPGPELCGNGIDDDCDGVVDSDAEGLGDPCDNGLLGACRREGFLICGKSEGELVCNAPLVEPSPEVCNGVDDDCDGQIDEGVLNVCGGCGELPGIPGERCQGQEGDECSVGVWACSDDSASGMECAIDPKLTDGIACSSDGNICTQDICKMGVCSHPPVLGVVPCDDMNSCTTDDICIGGVCVGGTQLSCDDGNKCTADFCDHVRGCYHNAIEGGVENACGGCGVLKHSPGEDCIVDGKLGACANGKFLCQPEGTITCVQVNFPKSEECNLIDDDCDGDIDEGFGQTTCGVGACEVTVENCFKGEKLSCIPKNPAVETCSNPGVDDDCNGVVDDIASLNEHCPVAVGTCIIRGMKRCLGDAEYPVCVALNPRDAEDDDGDGIPNYCDYGDTFVAGIDAEISGVSEGTYPSSQRLYNTGKTRAAILPWQNVHSSLVLSPRRRDQAMLIIAGSNGEVGGLSAIQAKGISPGAIIEFKSCRARDGATPHKILAAGDIVDVVASTRRSYLLFPKIATQIPSSAAGEGGCLLKDSNIFVQDFRMVNDAKGEISCAVERIFDIAAVAKSPYSFAGLVSCSIPSGSILKKDRHLLGMDLFARRSDGTFSHRFVPVKFLDAKADAGFISVGAAGIVIVAQAHGVLVAGQCGADDENFSCWHDDLGKRHSSVVALIQLTDSEDKKAIAIMDNGESVFLLPDSKSKKMRISKAGNLLSGGDGEITFVSEFPRQTDRSPVLIYGTKSGVEAAAVMASSDGSQLLRPMRIPPVVPESGADGIVSGEKMSFDRPHAFANLPLKDFGGMDLFAAFEIKKGKSKIGEMGFFYWNTNEPPSGSVGDIVFNGERGVLDLAFEDPSSDKLSYRAKIKAKHGGSLDSWLDGISPGKLKFSVKGDRSAVGVWPITIFVEVSDPGGLVSTSSIVLRQDGSVEKISETSSVSD